jgi:hypothetical protein
MDEDSAALEYRRRTSADWFFWIAGLSLINSLSSLSGTSIGFPVGLGVTHLVDALASDMQNQGKIIGFVINLFASGIVASFGYFARQGRGWGFTIGIFFYVLDALLLLLWMDILGILFHALALFFIFSGYVAHRKLQALNRS